MIGLGSDKKAKMYKAGLNMDSRYDWLSCITFGGSLSVLDGIYISPYEPIGAARVCGMYLPALSNPL